MYDGCDATMHSPWRQAQRGGVAQGCDAGPSRFGDGGLSGDRARFPSPELIRGYISYRPYGAENVNWSLAGVLRKHMSHVINPLLNSNKFLPANYRKQSRTNNKFAQYKNIVSKYQFLTHASVAKKFTFAKNLSVEYQG